MGWPVAASHRMMVRSLLADATVRPSALKATLVTARAWPWIGICKGR